MINKRGFPKIFFGWWTVLASGILMLWGHGYRAYGISALFKPISAELGFSRAATSVVQSIGRLEGGFEAPLAGWITDRYGPRLVVLSGVFLMGLGLILMNFVNSLWAFYIVWGVILGSGTNIALGIPIDKAISNWFVKKRGLAIGIKWVFSGLAGALVLPLIAWLITIQGWRSTCLIGGIVMLVVGPPLAWFCFKRSRPEYYGLLPDGATTEEGLKGDTNQIIERGVKYAAEVEEVEFTLRQAMRTPTYWLLLIAQATEGLVLPVILLHTIPFLTDRGIDPLKAAGIMAIMVTISIPVRPLGGFLADRVRKNQLRFLLGGAYFLQAVGFAVFLRNQTMAMIYVWLILYFFAHGIIMPLSAPMRARYFGRKAFGSIGGTSMMFMTPVAIIAPVWAGWVYDTTRSYITAFTLLAWLLVFSAILMSLILPPKPPAQVTDVRKFV